MSDPQSVWPDGAREAVEAAYRFLWTRKPNVRPPLGDTILTALEPFVQQRIEAALSEIDEMVPPAIGIYQTIPDRVRLVIAQRDEAESIVADLRAEVARLREDGDATLREFCGWLSGDIPALHAVEVPVLAESLTRFLAARSAPGGEG